MLHNSSLHLRHPTLPLFFATLQEIAAAAIVDYNRYFVLLLIFAELKFNQVVYWAHNARGKTKQGKARSWAVAVGRGCLNFNYGRQSEWEIIF